MTGNKYKIIYEDDWLIVADKPSGMLVIPTAKKETNTLTDLLNHDLNLRGIKVNAYPCHRLDRETSGVIIYAKGKSVQRRLMDDFKKRLVKKVYIAFSHGALKKDSGTIKSPIFNRKKGRSEEAVTNYRLIERKKDFSVLEIEPVTGRTNQIRIHFKELGHPLVGESVYAFRKDFPLKFKRVALHAKSVEFTHPITKKYMAFSSELPEDMKDFLHSA